MLNFLNEKRKVLASIEESVRDSLDIGSGEGDAHGIQHVTDTETGT